MDILEFQGEYRWLSNFWPAKVILDGVTYPSVENAFQAAKTTPENRAQFVNITAGQAKRLGRKVSLVPNWEYQRVSVMKMLLDQKFAIDTEFGQKLLETGDGQIVEGNNWGDKFWGVCQGEGENMLGKLLMQRRSYLRLMSKL